MTRQQSTHLSIITVLVLAAFSNIFQNGFIMDDYDFIVDWPLIQDWSSLYHFFVWYIPPDGQPGIYSPLKTFFHAVTFHFFGTNPFGYHVVSLMIHLISTVFVYRIAQFLTRQPLAAFIAALLFGLHPVQVEAITYMTASIDMIGIMFFFIAFDRYLRDKKVAAVIFTCLAVFTHELAISLPLLFVWYEFCLGEKRGRWADAFRRSRVFFLPVLFYVIAKYLVLGSVTRGGYILGSFYPTMLVTIKAFVQYLWICLWPLHLTVNHIIADGIYSYGVEDFNRYAVLSQSALDLSTAASFAVLIIVALILWKTFVSAPVVAFCIGWFFLSLFPVSNIIPSSIYFGERYLYPGLLGFCLLAGIFLTKFFESKAVFGKISGRILAWGLVVLLVSGYSLRTFVRNSDWKDQVSFYEAGVRGNPQSAFMRRDLGIIYFENGRLPEALITLKEAITLRPDDPDIYMAAAEVYKDLKQYPQAENFLQEAIRLKPDFAEAHFNLAGLYAAQGKKLNAQDHINKALLAYQNSGRFVESYEAWTAFYNYFNLK